MSAEDAVVDEEAFAATQRLIRVSALRGEPVEGDSCANCYYFLEPGEPLGSAGRRSSRPWSVKLVVPLLGDGRGRLTGPLTAACAQGVAEPSRGGRGLAGTRR